MKRDLQLPKPYLIVKSDKLKHSMSPSFYFGVKNGSPVSGMETRSLVGRRRLPCRMIVNLFWTKHAAPCQIKRGTFNLTIRRGQSNLSINFVSCVDKGYCRRLLYIEFSISFLIGQKCSVIFLNQCLWCHLHVAADYTIILPRTLKIMDNRVLYDCSAWFLSEGLSCQVCSYVNLDYSGYQKPHPIIF